MKTEPYSIPGMVLGGHEFSVPLDYDEPDRGKLTVFAREVVARDKANESLPWLIFFQGGPGFPSPRPGGKSGWLKRVLKDYRVLLLDQRGTGLSSPITYQTLQHFKSAREQAEFLRCFRADSIIKDAELIRSRLLGSGKKWTGFGQSYGGFCLAHYLSAAPEGLEAVIITGGLPPLMAHVDDIYRATYRRSLGKNKRYYKRYPMDVERVRNIVSFLQNNRVELPCGGILTPERFQQLGIAFGMSDSFEPIHYLLEDAFVETPGISDGKSLGFNFLRNVENMQAYETNPIYAFLHEAIYCQNFASKWSAHRVRSEFPEFDPNKLDGPIFFTGEMIYPSMFDDYKYLKPLKEAANILADYDDWPVLYDVGKLKQNKVPTVAAVFYDDMYVETSYSQEASEMIDNVSTWVTNEYEHNAIRADGERVLDRLLNMLNEEI